MQLTECHRSKAEHIAMIADLLGDVARIENVEDQLLGMYSAEVERMDHERIQ